VKDVSARRRSASRALKKEDQVFEQKLTEIAKKHPWRKALSPCLLASFGDAGCPFGGSRAVEQGTLLAFHELLR
jgi:hypothetical protein